LSDVRLLLVVPDSTGGIGSHVAALVEGLRGSDIEVHVAGPARTDRRFRFSDSGARYWPVEIAERPRPRHDPGTVLRLSRVLRLARPTVVHAHGLRAGALAVIARWRPGISPSPLMVTWHNAVLGGGPGRRLLTALEVLVARGADLTLGASGDLVERAVHLGARRAHLGAVAAPAAPGPVTARADTRSALGLGDRPFVLAVGRLAPQKDYPTLLAAARHWRERTPRPLVGIVGEGPLHDRLAARVVAEQLPVRLFGRRHDVADLLAAADVAVVSSVWEARSLYAQEVLRAGVPLVATAVGGIPELVGDAAVLVPAGDPAAMAGAVARVLASPELRERLSLAGPARAAGWPTQQDVTAELAALYRRLSPEPPRR